MAQSMVILDNRRTTTQRRGTAREREKQQANSMRDKYDQGNKQ
jgi:hypothetical protein